mmetsp:Transcript_18116/g.51657  ORF Transcript_18116/g.51657 Transcript_18116/m.51657 type:complete len:203 (-) Transcript_18116:1109-1717(-)
MKLLEGEERLLVPADVHVHEAKVVDGLEAVGADTDGLEVDLLGALVLLVHEHAICPVDEGAGVVAVRLDGDLRGALGLSEVGLEEVEEGQVRRRARHQRRILALEGLQHSDGLVELLPLHVVRSLGDLQLRGDAGEAVVVQRTHDPIVALFRRSLDARRDQVRGVDDVPRGLPLPPLHVLPQGVVAVEGPALASARRRLRAP